MDTGGHPVAVEPLEQAVRRALEARDMRHAEVSLTLLGDDAMQALNREHLDHDWPTDVLAFALWSEGDPVVVGDVYVGFEQALRQAGDEGVDPLEELQRLAVHGTLHVTGLDHPDEARERTASPMYVLQESLVQALRAGEAP